MLTGDRKRLRRKCREGKAGGGIAWGIVKRVCLVGTALAVAPGVGCPWKITSLQVRFADKVFLVFSVCAGDTRIY